jgi:hypothetical protein
MRCRLTIVPVLATCLLMGGSLEAAVIKGRVVDSAGEPVAGAEIRIWRRARPMGGAGRVNEPVLFDDKQTLLADDAGRFQTPDLFDTTTPVRIVALAQSMLAERSGWLLPSNDVTEVDDIVLARLRSIVGQVVDSQGAPIAEATVFNGDGHQRVETKTGSTGKFFLEDVPENALFLFAQKPGYRLTGILLDAEKAAELRMDLSDEPIEPLKSRDPVLAAEERVALARRLLNPYLEAVRQQGNDTDKYYALYELSTIDPAAAANSLERVGFKDLARKENCRLNVMLNWMKAARNWEDLRAFIESSENGPQAASMLIDGGTYNLPQIDPDRSREWLNEGLVRARALPATARFRLLAIAAEGFWRIGDRERATMLAREADSTVKEVPRESVSDSALARLARALAPVDLPAAIGWLDQVKNDLEFCQEGAFVAWVLARIDASKAAEVWNHIHDRAAKDRALMERRDLYAPEFCFRLGRLDPDRAKRIAAAVESPLWRVQALAAVAHAVGGETAKGLLREAVADPKLQEIVIQPNPYGVPRTAATALAAILPVAERIDPLPARELLWQALSLRPPQPSAGLLDDEWLRADVSLAQMIARYEPAIARRLLERAVERLPQLTSRAENAQKPMPVVVATAFVEPNWAIEVLDRLPEPPDVSWQRHPKNQARLFLVRMLGSQGSEYWRRAGFWEPEE